MVDFSKEKLVFLGDEKSSCPLLTIVRMNVLEAGQNYVMFLLRHDLLFSGAPKAQMSPQNLKLKLERKLGYILLKPERIFCFWLLEIWTNFYFDVISLDNLYEGKLQLKLSRFFRVYYSLFLEISDI